MRSSSSARARWCFRSTSPELSARHYELRDQGASSDYPDYNAHVTITYALPEGMDLSEVEPYDGPLHFGPEVFEVIGKGFDPALT